jgi:hypothetical protein
VSSTCRSSQSNDRTRPYRYQYFQHRVDATIAIVVIATGTGTYEYFLDLESTTYILIHTGTSAQPSRHRAHVTESRFHVTPSVTKDIILVVVYGLRQDGTNVATLHSTMASVARLLKVAWTRRECAIIHF